MDIRHPSYFIAIAETGSISRAASQLYISQPAITQYLNRLEYSIGAKLFERVNGKLLPTQIGSIYLQASYAILAKERETDNLINEVRNGTRGELKIVLSYAQIIHRIHRIFIEIKKHFPDVSIVVVDRPSKECLNAVAQGLADIGVVSYQVPDPSLAFEPLWDDYPLLVTGHHHNLDTLAKQPEDPEDFPEVDLADLTDREFLFLKDGNVRKTGDKLFQKAGYRPQIALECTFARPIIQIVEHTDYVGIVPVALTMLDKNVRYYRIKSSPCWHVAAVYRENMPLSEHHKYFIEVMKQLRMLDESECIEEKE